MKILNRNHRILLRAETGNVGDTTECNLTRVTQQELNRPQRSRLSYSLTTNFQLLGLVLKHYFGAYLLNRTNISHTIFLLLLAETNGLFSLNPTQLGTWDFGH